MVIDIQIGLRTLQFFVTKNPKVFKKSFARMAMSISLLKIPETFLHKFLPYVEDGSSIMNEWNLSGLKVIE